MNELIEAIKRQPSLPRFLCHIYQRLKQQRLNLVAGAGISIDSGVPSWLGLLESLTEHSETLKEDLDAHRKSGLSPEYLGQIIYHRHRHDNDSGTEDMKGDATINYGWAEAIHGAIYKDVTTDIEQLVSDHPYLGQLRDLTRKVPMVINFNFDDILAQAVGKQITEDGKGNSFSVEWRPTIMDRKDHTTIYHVNGLLPQVSLKKRSPKLIFTEDSFTDAIARSPGMSADYLLMRFIQNTMLIIGHSLGDASLKNYLRQNKDKSPANHHYMIYWIPASGGLSGSRQSDIFEANLELYNLITVFLTSDEINEFLSVLNKDERDFIDFLESVGGDKRACYCYYIAGPVAAGKSSLLEHLRCFETYEEWTRPPPKEMYLSFNKLTPEETNMVDGFIYSELKEKNRRLSRAEIGFHFMDRAPLDLYAFSKDEAENKEKTVKLQRLVVNNKRLQDGEILFIYAKGETLVERNYSRGRRPEDAGSALYYDDQSNGLKKIYSPTFCLDTNSHTAGQVAKKVVRHVLLGKYSPVDLNAVMERYK